MHKATQDHYKAMLGIMKYSVGRVNQGLVLKPHRKWDGSQNHKFIISGRSDSDYAKEPKDRHSISGHMVYLEGAPTTFKSSIERTVSLSTTEEETSAGVTCMQDILYMKNILESLGLKVKLPIVLEMDNQGRVYSVNNWSVGGRTRHIHGQSFFLQELKEAGIRVITWIAGTTNEADIFTKNLDGSTFQRCTNTFTGGTDYE
jgi:hypothetical protein